MKRQTKPHHSARLAHWAVCTAWRVGSRGRDHSGGHGVYALAIFVQRGSRSPRDAEIYTGTENVIPPLFSASCAWTRLLDYGRLRVMHDARRARSRLGTDSSRWPASRATISSQAFKEE